MSDKVDFRKPEGDNSDNPFLTMDEHGKLVARRVPTPADVRTIFSQCLPYYDPCVNSAFILPSVI